MTSDIHHIIYTRILRLKNSITYNKITGDVYFHVSGLLLRLNKHTIRKVKEL